MKITTRLGYLLVAGCLTGCSGSAPSGNPRAAPPAPAILPDLAVYGRVVSVNPALRYVVMDFPIRSVPAVGQTLQVYRQDQKVGEVRVSGPILGTAAAGDLLAGQAAVNDEVREY
jgi:hypothetical protein